MLQPQTLRGYQSSGIRKALDAWRGGARSILFVLPTGGGKTSCFTHLISQMTAPAAILVHRRELATQAANRLREFSVDFGYILAGEPVRPSARVQIASVQTLVRRLDEPAVAAMCRRTRLVVPDEAHLSTAATWQTVLGTFPDAKILGCTATPWRLGGKPLVTAYDACVVAATPRELREQGHLCDYVGFSYLAPDLSAVETVAGEYNEKQSAEAMRQPAIVANIVEKWLEHASDLTTLVFAVTVEHSKTLAAEFRAAGVQAEHLDGSTPTHMRAAILRRVEQGHTRVLCNVGVLIEGLDIPRIKCIVLARPTKSLARYLQQVGRGRRPWNGARLRIHDHAFLIKQHGLPDDDRDYTLNAKTEKPLPVTRCEQCLANYRGPHCPACAHENEPTPKGERELVTVDDAELFEFDSTTVSEPAAPVLPKPPVEIRWDTRGRVVEGHYTDIVEKDGQFGARRHYVLRGAKRDYHLPETAHLRALMPSGATGRLTRVTYLGDLALSGGRWRKTFKVEVDDAA